MAQVIRSRVVLFVLIALTVNGQNIVSDTPFFSNTATFYGDSAGINNNDGSTDPIGFGFAVTLGNQTYEQLFINTNGNITFEDGFRDYTPQGIATVTVPMFAPFWADIDLDEPVIDSFEELTREDGGRTVTYGVGAYKDRPAFAVNWIDVLRYGDSDEPPFDIPTPRGAENSFQIIIVDRSDLGDGDFDVYYHYDKVEWEIGEADGPNDAPTVGYTNGEGTYEEVEGSGVPGAFIDGGPNSLSEQGQLMFEVRNGVVQGNRLEAFLELVNEVGGRVDEALQQINDKSVTRMVHHFHRLSRKGRHKRRVKQAGDWVENLEVTVDHSYTQFDHKRDGNGSDRETVTTLSGQLGDSTNFGISMIHDRYELDQTSNLEMNGEGVSFYLNQMITDNLAFGVFGEYSEYDVEDVETALGTISGSTLGRASVGVSASYNTDVADNLNVGLTTMLASTNRNSLDDIFDKEDSLVIAMLDANHYVTERTSVSAYAQAVSNLDINTDGDSNYWVVGGDISFAANDRLALSVGVEKTLEDRDYDDSRISISIGYGF